MPGRPSIPNRPTPLYIVAAALVFAELAIALVASLSVGGVQTAFTVFAILYPTALLVAFFWIWVKRPWLLYPPTEFEDGNAFRDYVATVKSGSSPQTDVGSPTAQSPEANADGAAVLDTEESRPPADVTAPSCWRETRSQMIDAAFQDKSREALDAAYVTTSRFNLSHEETAESKILYNELKYMLGDSGAMADLLALESEGIPAAEVQAAAGICLVLSSEYEAASEHYLRAVEAESDYDQAAHYAAEAYAALAKAGRVEEAIVALSRRISGSQSDAATRVLLEKLAEVYDHVPNNEMRAIILDKILELSPNDTKILFSAGYAYSQAGQPQLAVLYYGQQLSFTEDPMARNNLGVAYDALDLPISSIDAYQRAHESENTLASANLAFKLIGAGFAHNADQLLVDVEDRPDVHNNVHDARASLNRQKQKESDRKKDIRAQALARRDFIRGFADSILDVDGTALPSGRWTGGPFEYMETSLDGTSFEAETSGEKKALRMRGETAGRGAKVAVEAGTPRVYGEGWSYTRDGEGYVYYDTSTDTIHVLLLSKGAPDRFFVFERANNWGRP